MTQQVLTAVGKRPVVEPEPNGLLPTPGKHQTLGLDEHTPSVEQNRPPGPRRFQSEDHAYWFDGGDNEVRNPYRPTRTYPRQPERDEFPRDFRGQQMANSRYNFEQPRAHDDMRDLTKRVNIEAPEFDGRIYHNVFLDWIDALEDYFDWYRISEGQKVRFAKLRLVGSAKKYWQGIQKQLEHLGQEPITLWAEMKLRLKEKYLPPSYKNLLLDQLLNLKQASSSVTDYLIRFEDLRVRCEIKEEPCVATARRRPTPFENFQPPQSTSLESASSLPRAPQGIKSFKPGSNPSSSSQIECFNCHAKGHIASCCPTRTLALTEELDTPPINEQDVEIVEPLEDCDDLGLDILVGHNVGLLGVIRCIPTREFDSESLSFGLYSSYTIARICLEPLPTLSFQKLSAHPIGLGLSSLTLGSTTYLLNLPTNLTIA
ncbi:hypothetical protein LWI29_022501 [Acer saccharum]|uniref:CCHC-type domain-containing protein n=1 Tax=Acer saccharum TaxID=4024 RepID=A0AA39V8M6_ACESA|nr:hypothetical protein LWI29_022501 [Acer saccharum]